MNKKITLRELQFLQLEIANEIKRVCDENNINYFIVGGTLLGAVRHRGFIPWDDDMDFGMTLENYKKFNEVAKTCLTERFILQNSETEKNYGYTFSKVRMKGTHMKEKVSENIDSNDGVFVDIFPYITISENKAKSKLFLRILNLLGKASLLKHGYNLSSLTNKKRSKLINFFLKHFPVSVQYVDNLIDKQIEDFNGEYLIEKDGMFKGNFIFPKKLFNEFVELDFENTKFKAPREFDSYLKIAYGDYMTYPSVEERSIGHSVVDVYVD